MEQAKEIKDKGNLLYKQGRFDEALKCYQQASALQPLDPTFHANISAAQYEIGKYSDCIKSITCALELLSPPAYKDNPHLAARLLLRKAKSLFYCQQNNEQQVSECTSVLSQLSLLCKELGIDNMDADGALKKGLSHRTVLAEQPVSSIFRQPIDTRGIEYFLLGHDYASSCFAGLLSEQQQKSLDSVSKDINEHPKRFHQFNEAAPLRINLRQTTQESFSFLFGGIGDARHLMTSLRDLGETCEFPTSKSFRFTMVDIKATIIARDLVIFYILNRLAKLDQKLVGTSIESIELLSLAVYTFVGTVMPDYLFDLLEVLIKELISDLRNNTLPPWLVVDKASIPAIMPILEDWADFKVSTTTMLARTTVGNKQFAACLNESNYTPGYNLPSDPLVQLQKMAQNATDEMLISMGVPGNTMEEKRKQLARVVANADIGELAANVMLFPELASESKACKDVPVVFPPAALKSRHAELHELLQCHVALQSLDKRKQNAGGEETVKKLQNGKLQRSALDHVRAKFKPNPTFWDSVWLESAGDTFHFQFSAFETVYYLCPNINYPKECKLTQTYDFLAPFFAGAALALAEFGNKGDSELVLEWIVADIYQTCSNMMNTAQYDRIYLSNIPDYAGGNLPVTVFCAPLLKPIPHSFVSYSILINKGYFTNVDDCMKAYMSLLDTKQVGKFVAMEFIHGELWSSHIKWRTLACPSPVSALPTQDELSFWLHRLFLQIVLPPERGSVSNLRIDYPLNLVAFVELVIRLASVGYPHHWLANVLDSLLSGNIKTKARPPPNSMNLQHPSAFISTQPFVSDLEYALALHPARLPFRLLTALPPNFQTITFRPDVFAYGQRRTCVLGVYVGPFKGIFDAQTRLKELRNTIVQGNPPVGVLLSAMSWDSTTLSFCLDTSKYEQMVKGDWSMVVVRLDDYTCISLESTKLRI